MELLKKISDHEIKLLLVFITLIIFVGSYQLGYQNYHKKAGSLKMENTNLKIQMNELETKEANRKNILNDTANMTAKVDSLLREFPSSLLQEKSTLFISELAHYSGLKISTISYDDSIIFYSETNMAGTAVNGSDTAIAGNDSAAAGNDITTAEADTIGLSATEQSEAAALTGYKTAVTIAYQTTYGGLKKSIRYINDYKERMNIMNLTASFDNTTGNLTGIMTIELYAVSGGGRVPEEPVINGVQLGTDNIFGAFEIPTEGAVYDE